MTTTRKNATNRSFELVAEICLYGNRSTGAGWLASARIDGGSKMFGNGEPRALRSFSDAVFLACREMQEAGVSGMTWVYAAGGEHRGKISVDRPIYFGDIKWEAAPMLEIAMEDILAVAESPA